MIKEWKKIDKALSKAQHGLIGIDKLGADNDIKDYVHAIDIFLQNSLKFYNPDIGSESDMKSFSETNLSIGFAFSTLINHAYKQAFSASTIQSEQVDSTQLSTVEANPAEGDPSKAGLVDDFLVSPNDTIIDQSLLKFVALDEVTGVKTFDFGLFKFSDSKQKPCRDTDDSEIINFSVYPSCDIFGVYFNNPHSLAPAKTENINSGSFTGNSYDHLNFCSYGIGGSCGLDNLNNSALANINMILLAGMPLATSDFHQGKQKSFYDIAEGSSWAKLSDSTNLVEDVFLSEEQTLSKLKAYQAFNEAPSVDGTTSAAASDKDPSVDAKSPAVPSDKDPYADAKSPTTPSDKDPYADAKSPTTPSDKDTYADSKDINSTTAPSETKTDHNSQTRHAGNGAGASTSAGVTNTVNSNSATNNFDDKTDENCVGE